jgi:phenylacetate-CoA ligase
MIESIPYYWQSLDWPRLMRDYEPPPHFHSGTGRLSADALRALQEERFRARLAEAWHTPFYRERWRAAGLAPGDVKGLDDITKLPLFTSDDLKDAIAAAPPFGSHHPIARDGFGRFPLKIQTSGGTTGLPRVTLFDAVAWEVQGIQTARAFWAQGGRPGDIVQIPYTNSLANAAWCATTGALHWLGAVPMNTGSGQVTPSERQLEYAKAWGTNFWFARGEYLARLAEVARETKFDLHALRTKFLHSYLGSDSEGHLRAKLEEAWGAPVYDNYGTHEIGLIAFECEMKDRKHISEDTVFLELVDPDDGTPTAQGARGNLVATSLHRSMPPIIRFNLRDLFTVDPREECACGLATRRLSAFHGRSDEMVKLRGTNVYPMACQNAVLRDPRGNGEFLCVVRHDGDGLARREAMTVRVERRTHDIDADAFAIDMRAALLRDLGVRVEVEIVDPGSLATHTRLGGEGKIRRLLDQRKRCAT